MNFSLRRDDVFKRVESNYAYCSKVILCGKIILMLRRTGKSVPFSLYFWTNEALDAPLEGFLASVRFEQRDKVAKLPLVELPIDLYDFF